MKRNFRLTRSTDYKRVRRSGKSYAHPLVVLVVLPVDGDETLFGVTAGQSVGKAYQRNKAKRLIREALRPLVPLIKPGWKAIFISRRAILEAEFTEIQTCLRLLLTRADLIEKSNE